MTQYTVLKILSGTIVIQIVAENKKNLCSVPNWLTVNI